MSRRVSLPAHVVDAEGGLPQGFRASGVAAGLKPSGGTDIGLLVSDTPGTVSAARFTLSGVLAAPVILCQERCALDSLRAVVVNSGNANAATGRLKMIGVVGEKQAKTDRPVPTGDTKKPAGEGDRSVRVSSRGKTGDDKGPPGSTKDTR